METQNTITVRKHNVASSNFAFKDWGIGVIEINTMHYDHTSEMDTTIEVIDIAGSTQSERDKLGWGKTIWKGTIAELIAQLYKAKSVDVLKVGEATKPTSEVTEHGA